MYAHHVLEARVVVVPERFGGDGEQLDATAALRTVTSTTRWYSVGSAGSCWYSRRVSRARASSVSVMRARAVRGRCPPRARRACPPLGRAVEPHVERRRDAGRARSVRPGPSSTAPPSAASAAMLSSTRSRTWSRRSSGSRGAGKVEPPTLRFASRAKNDAAVPRRAPPCRPLRHSAPRLRRAPGSTGRRTAARAVVRAAARSHCRPRRTSPTASRTAHLPRTAAVTPCSLF